MKTIFITGAHGFLGRHAARHFQQNGWRVIGIGHGHWSEQEWRSWGLGAWHPSDVNTGALATYAREPDVILHCAGGADVAFSMNHPKQDFDRTVSTTLSVMEYVRLHSPNTKVVYPSSAAVYGTAKHLPIQEDKPLSPVSFYGVNKLMGEQLVRNYAKHFQVPSSIVRFFSVYGPGLKKQILWDACCRLREDQNGFFGTGMETRDFVHVEDAVRLLRAAAAHAGPDCPIRNGGSGEATTIQDLLTTVFDCLGRSDRPVFLNKERAGDPQHYLADITRTKQWGWRPERNIHDGVREYVGWFTSDAM